jgi:hypothetical protein
MKNNILELCLHTYGCRVEKALEVIYELTNLKNIKKNK